MSTEPTRSGQGPHLDPSRLSFWSDVDVNDRNDVEEFLAGVEADRNASPGFSADLPTSIELDAEHEHLRSCKICVPRLGEVTSSFAFAVQRSDQAGLPGALPSSDMNRRRDAISAALGAFDEEHVLSNAPLDRQAKVSWWRRRSAAAGSGARSVGVGGARESLVFTPARVLAAAAALSLVTGVVLFQQRQSDSTANAPITEAAVATEVDAASGGNDSPLDARSSEFDIAESAESVEAPNRAAATEAAANGAADSGAADSGAAATGTTATGTLKAPSSGVQGESSVPASSSDDRAALDMVMPAEAPSAVPTNSPTMPRPPSTEASPPRNPTTRRAATTVPTSKAAATTPAARVPGDAGPVSAEPAFDALPSTVTTRGSRTTARKTAKKATPTTKASATTATAMPQAGAASSATALPAADLGDLGPFADLAAGSDALRQLAVQRGITANPTPALEATQAPAPATTAAPASVPASSTTTPAAVAPAAGAVEAAPVAPAPGPPVCQVPGAYAVARLSVAGRPLLGFVTGPPQAPVIVLLDLQACTIVG